MTSNINYKDTLFKQVNLTPICGEPTFKTIHKIWNEIKSNSNAVAHGHLGLALTEVQYTLISTTPFVYPTHPGPLIIPDGMTAHANSNIPIAHTEEVRLFRDLTGVEQVIVQK